MSRITSLDDYRHQRADRTKAAALQVKREVDPDWPNRSYYLIAGDEAAAVQTAIDGLVAEVESFGNGHGSFYGPHKFSGRYFAVGSVVVFPDPYGPPDV